MERRVLLAVLLSFVVLLVYQTLVVKPRVRPEQGRPGQPRAAAPSPATAEPQGAAGAPDAAPSAPVEAAPAVTVGGSTEQDVLVETDLVRAVFTTRGAVLKSWQLKQYLDSEGQPIDLIPQAIANPARRPFAITLGDEALTERLNTAVFKPSHERLDVGSGSGTLEFSYADAAGVAVTKRFEFQPDNEPYVIRLTPQVTVHDAVQRVTVNGGAGFGDIERGTESSGFLAVSTYQPPQAIYQLGPDVTRTPQAEISEQPAVEGALRYAGVDDHYFLAAAVPGETHTRVEYTAMPITTGAGPRTIVDYRVRIAGGGPIRFFYGPKEFDALERVDSELVRTIHFGVFGFLATPLLKSLKWINGFVGNYGWSIILLTVIINLLMFPLRHKSAVSMRKMQDIQPQVKAIQERYSKLKATDPARQKMNTELMNLYRERGVNPASGCVPMLLTFPVLFAFYALLSVAIELRGAPWIGWITDLSTYDPLYITPVLMGLSQFWQTKMMPTTGDPMQQRMMMFMPLMFMVFFLWAPSGLVIYWLVSNVWTIGQQYLTNHLIARSPQGGTVAAARRPRGRTDSTKPGGSVAQ